MIFQPPNISMCHAQPVPWCMHACPICSHHRQICSPPLGHDCALQIYEWMLIRSCIIRKDYFNRRKNHCSFIRERLLNTDEGGGGLDQKNLVGNSKNITSHSYAQPHQHKKYLTPLELIFYMPKFNSFFKNENSLLMTSIKNVASQTLKKFQPLLQDLRPPHWSPRKFQLLQFSQHPPPPQQY